MPPFHLLIALAMNAGAAFSAGGSAPAAQLYGVAMIGVGLKSWLQCCWADGP